MKKEWREGQTRSVELPDDDPTVFRVWLNWIYRRHVAVGPNTGETMDDHYTNQQVWSQVIASYVLGDKLLDVDFKDAVVDTMAALMMQRDKNGMCHLPNPRERIQLFQSTMPGCMARKLLIHQMARAKYMLVEDDDPALIFAVAKLTVKPDSEDTPQVAARCEFHEHGQKQCHRTKYTVVSTLI